MGHLGHRGVRVVRRRHFRPGKLRRGGETTERRGRKGGKPWKCAEVRGRGVKRRRKRVQGRTSNVVPRVSRGEGGPGGSQGNDRWFCHRGEVGRGVNTGGGGERGTPLRSLRRVRGGKEGGGQ